MVILFRPITASAAVPSVSLEHNMSTEKINDPKKYGNAAGMRSTTATSLFTNNRALTETLI